jgi:hypothetical protein
MIEYVKLLRAQPSNHEVRLLFHTCSNEKGMRKTKALVERYALLEHLPKEKLSLRLPEVDHGQGGIYERGAFEATWYGEAHGTLHRWDTMCTII